MGYDYGYYSPAPSIGPFQTFLLIIFSILSIASLWRIFVKAGEPGWASIIPIYNFYVLFKITWGSGIKFLLILIPFVNFIIGIMTISKLSKSFGKGGGFTLGLILLAPIFMPVLAFGSSTYLGAGGYGGYSGGSHQQQYDTRSYGPPQGSQPPPQYSPQGPQSGYNPDPGSRPQYAQQYGQQNQQVAGFCPNCGNRIEAGTRFCQTCGAQL